MNPPSLHDFYHVLYIPHEGKAPEALIEREPLVPAPKSYGNKKPKTILSGVVLDPSVVVQCYPIPLEDLDSILPYDLKPTASRIVVVPGFGLQSKHTQEYIQNILGTKYIDHHVADYASVRDAFLAAALSQPLHLNTVACYIPEDDVLNLTTEQTLVAGGYMY